MSEPDKTPARESKRALAVALGANLAAAGAKLAGFAVSGSGGLLAEAVHSLADCGNQVLLLLGRRLADRPPTPQHPFGYGRLRFFWAFVVAELLFGGGAVFAIADGIHRLGDTEHPSHLATALVLLGLAGIVELVSLAEAVREARHERHDDGWIAFLRNTTDPDLAILLVEDVTDIAGVVFALAGLGLADLTGDPRYDAWAGIAIGVALAVNAAVLAWEMASLLIGETASDRVVAAVRAAILSGEGVVQIVELRTVQLGPDDVLVVARVAFDPGTSRSLVELAHDVSSRVSTAAPAARHVSIQPVEAESGAISD
ncbi:MAG TPA: cation diffusion facilitator family transporter [Gaiellaceae bacterium]|jgi:cation diffusion facilitator family transporter